MSLTRNESKELLLFRSRIVASPRTEDQKSYKFFQLFNLIITQLTDKTSIQFTSLFARLSYLISHFKIPHQESYILHSFRISRNLEDSQLGKQGLLLAETSVKILMARVMNENEDLGMVARIYQELSRGWRQSNLTYEKEIRVLLKSIDIKDKRIEGQLCKEPFTQIRISYNRPDKNEDYTEIIEKLEKLEELPLLANLIDVEITEDQVYFPGSIVLKPDFLFDVTAISECFGAFANHHAAYLMRKFLKKPVSKPLLIGNLVNYFLDQLIYHPNLEFKDLISKIFTLDPLATSLLSDQEVREMMVLLELHFSNIKNVVNKGFKKINVQEDSCQVEPSFYSAKYGIQGRLDLFARKSDSATIIELKSGSTFRPNNYGLSNNHYHQTLLYDMLIESVYGIKVRRNNFILYSKESTKTLRYAPALKSEQREAIKERNQLLLHDLALLKSMDFVSYYEIYAKKHTSSIKGFLRKDINQFLKVLKQLNPIERKYCNSLLKFTLRELFINKLGNEGSARSQGLASLWLEDVDSKKEQYNIINHLKISEDKARDDNPKLILIPTEHTARLNNFRIGDLGVLYPVTHESDAVLRNQVFKVTLISITDKEIIIRLRSRQDNPNTFNIGLLWNIEHDTLENGYYDMSRSIYEFANAKSEFRDLLLGKRSPSIYKNERVSCSHHLTEEQQRLFSEIIKSKEYYLLWGPPGTGKTSIMLREIAHHFITHEKDRVLFLAYTNRAVDEICEALCNITPQPSFIRIGSRYSTNARFHPFLLDEQIKGITNRKSLKEKLQNEQVYVGTVASLVGKVALFELINFDLAIVDEASQILETSLIGLLSRVNKFILIGDHLQLPAIVRQEKSLTEIDDVHLNQLGIQKLSSSLFERMYKTAIQNNWDHAIGQLTFQGRMHVDIMNFVNKHFYNFQLKPLEKLPRLIAKSVFGQLEIARIIYIQSPVDLESDSIKVNNFEAELVVDICKETIHNCLKAGIEIKKTTIGIITPYRAQIAAIRTKLKDIDQDIINNITIDTVERYQGGARDIIIMSCCMNYSFQLNALVSLSDEGVDRKLNVAITRAREQFIIIGNQNILEQNDVYKNLLAEASQLQVNDS